MITRMDRDIGRLTDLISSRGVDRQTLILFISDNGPHQEGGGDPQFFKSSGGLRGIKRDLYEGGIRVPMIARWTGTIPTGRVSDQPWAHWDIFPTLAELGHARVPDRLDGRSMVRVLRGESAPPHDTFYWEFHERGFQQAVRMGQWKAVRLKPGAPLELYDLATDPYETRDVASTHADAVAHVEQYLKTARTPSERWPEPIPGGPLKFGAFTARFASDGSFTLEGQGWPPFKGTWKADGSVVDLIVPSAPAGCEKTGQYRTHVDNDHVSFAVIGDDCVPRRMILDRSEWRPEGEIESRPERRIVRTASDRPFSLRSSASAANSWPSFRGPQASGIAEGQHLPDRWDTKSRENILWRTAVPGLAHSSPIVWGDRVFVTSAISSKPNATFRPGLYGDGDASDDRSRQRWMLYAFDKRTGKPLWERVAFEGVPVDKRHVKSTYASATPATDGRMVVASFGSQGVYAYDVDGDLRWKVDLGRLNLGAYDIPTYEWGPASSPIIWNGLVILQCDNQADSFLLALKLDTGEIVWKTERDELPSWGTPTVAATKDGPVLVTNASNFIRGYDPRTGKELWRLGGSSKITAPTPIFADDLIVVASGRGPERPIFVVRPGAHGDLTLPQGKTSSDSIVWSRTGRGPYMPTPLIYKSVLYILANNGVFDAYNLRTGEELYRQRLERIGSGFSASPIAADDKIYLSNEDGEMVVVAAGPTFREIATNSMGELLMATPALSEGVMFVRTANSLVAIGSRR
jgi:outer membrane protein assembly factor BamB